MELVDRSDVRLAEYYNMLLTRCHSSEFLRNVDLIQVPKMNAMMDIDNNNNNDDKDKSCEF